MDTRKYDARAQIGAATPPARTAGAAAFLDRVIDLSKANWEVFFYIGLMLVAVFTRLDDLGPRALHHDESIHAYYSSQYLKGGGYSYDPTYHGPFLYHIVALGFFLFGTTDAMARIMPAIFGIILVGMCWFLRPFIGRVGAIVAVILVTLSPSISYYSRSLRHDIFALAGEMVLFVSILWFMRTHQAKWVYIGATAFTIALTSHELMYIVAVIFTAYLIIAYFAYPTIARRAAYNARNRRGEEDVNPVSSALQSLGRQRWTLMGAVIIFVAIFTLLYTNMLTKFTYASETFRAKDAAGNPVAGSVAPVVPFFTALIDGPYYWATQQGVQRGNQPHFYYLMMMPIYEALAFFAGLGTTIYLIIKGIMGGGTGRYSAMDEANADVEGNTDQYGVALPSIWTMRGFTMGFLVFWSFGALVAFSLAGERLPWLLMQTALPFSLLAAAGLGRLLTSMQWREIWKGGGAFIGVSVLLFLFAAMAFVNFLASPKNTTGNAGFVTALQGVLLFVFTFGLLALSGWLAYRIMPGRAVAVVGVTFAAVLLLYGIRSMTLLNFRHGDVPIEMLVYTQSAPDVPLVADRIMRLSRDETSFDAGRSATDVTGGHGLAIAIDQSVEWPFDWYLRDMKAITYYNTNQWVQKQENILPPSAPVVIASDETVANANFQAAVKDKYATQKFVLRWWFPEELYKTNNEGDLGKAIAWMTSQAFVKYLLYRDPALPLGSTDFTLYVRNDLAVKAGMPGSGLTVPTGSTTPTPADSGPASRLYDLGPAGAKKGQFNLPRGIARDSQGNFFVSDTANFRVQKFDKDGNFVLAFGSKGNGDGQFNPPDANDPKTFAAGVSGVAVDKSGNVYVADTWNHRIQKFDNTGKFLNKWGSFISLADDQGAADPDKNNKVYGPRGVAIGADGNVYVTDTGNKRILIFDANGRYIRQISGGLTPDKIASNYPFNKPGEFVEPMGIVVDSANNVYVADTNNRRIQKFDNTGKFVAEWPLGSGMWDPGTFLEPFLGIDSAGNIYATAPTGKTVVKFSPAGQILGQKNKEGAVTLQQPTGIFVDPDGTVYVVDTNTTNTGVVKLGKIP